MHNPASVLENETHKLLWDFDIQIDHLILTRRPDLVIINKKKKRFTTPTDHGVKFKESEKKDKYPDLAWELKKLEHENDFYTSCDWCSWYKHQRIDTKTGGHRNNKMSGGNPKYCIIGIWEES